MNWAGGFCPQPLRLPPANCHHRSKALCSRSQADFPRSPEANRAVNGVSQRQSGSCTDAIRLSIASALPATGISAGSHFKSLLVSITFQRHWVYFSVAHSWAELGEMHQSNRECCKCHEKMFAKWDFPQFLQSKFICCNSLSQRAWKPVWWRQTLFW